MEALLTAAARAPDIDLGSSVRPPVADRVEHCVFLLSADPVTGRGSGMAVSWLQRSEHSPEMWTVSVHRRSHTLELIRRSGEFVLAFATPMLKEAFIHFGLTSGAEPGSDKIAAAGLYTVAAQTPGIRTPLLLAARANLVFRLCEIKEPSLDGTHFQVSGRLVEAHYNPDAGDQLYYRGKNRHGERVFITVPAAD